MPHRLAFFTFGPLLEPVGHPCVQGFVDRVPTVYTAADHSEGFIDGLDFITRRKAPHVNLSQLQKEYIVRISGRIIKEFSVDRHSLSVRTWIRSK